MSEWLTREEALDRLGVRPQTLYAYVSRGRIGMRPDPVDPRRSQYRADDIAGLASRRARGRRASAIAESAIAWGEPAIATAISTVLHGRLIYRGHDAAMLAAHATLEETAAILWATPEPPVFSTPEAATAQEGRPAVFACLADLAGRGRASLGRGAAAMHADAAEAIGALGGAVGAAPGPEPIHARLGRGWSLDAVGAEAIRHALVLLADHELNASTFAARVAASTGAPMAACLLAGLSALSGPRHGGAGEAVAQLAEDAARHGAGHALERWLDHDRPPPGFGHQLYPEGDVRAGPLLAIVDLDDTMQALRDAAFAMTGARPNIDFALAALTRCLGLPSDAPFRLFALGRAVGWTAHAVEQVTSRGLIRPRARYEGPLPASD